MLGSHQMLATLTAREADTPAPYARDPLGRHVNPYFFILPPSHAIDGILEAPHRLFIEVGRYAMLQQAMGKLLADAPDFALCMTTVSAFRLPSVRPLAQALDNRFGLLAPIQDQVETCLHEAMSNAIIHGNLELDSAFSNSQGMSRYYAEAEKRMGLADYAQRRISICAWNHERNLTLCVTDQGGGFRCPSQKPQSNLPHGRGLQLIHSMTESAWLGNDGRSLFMNFNYH